MKQILFFILFFTAVTVSAQTEFGTKFKPIAAPKFGAICAKPDLRKFLPFEDMYPYKRSKIDCKSSAKSLPVKV